MYTIFVSSRLKKLGLRYNEMGENSYVLSWIDFVSIYFWAISDIASDIWVNEWY